MTIGEGIREGAFSLLLLSFFGGPSGGIMIALLIGQVGAGVQI